jgi:putative endopeptidase
MRTALVLVLAAACGSGRPATTNPAPPPDKGPAPPIVTTEPAPPDTPSKPVTNRSLDAIGLDASALDRSVDPCDDFYKFACGGYIAKTEIPADKPEVMRSFVAIDDRNQEYLHGVLEQLRTKATSDIEKKLGAYYGSCMDEAAVDKAGAAPLAPMRAWIAGVRDAKSLSNVVAQLHAAGFQVLFAMGPTQDSADATSMIANIDQGGIGLPDRDYYLNDDAQSQELRGKYKAYIAKLLAELGDKATDKAAEDIVALETQIAKVSKDKVARRDPKGTYNKIDKAGVAKAMPHFDWATYWNKVGLAKVDGVTVTSPEFLAGVDALLASTKPEVWRSYLTFQLATRAAPYLTKRFADAQFAFTSALTGQQEQEVRWKKCVAFTDGALGDALGQLFVRDRFPGASKEAAEGYVHAISTAMTANLDQLPWMDAQTKTKAVEKLQKMIYQIGFPGTWKTYAFAVDPNTFAANALTARKVERARQLAKIGKPVDKGEWDLSPPTVNAFYDPQLNRMVFPAGILQPPFYSVDAAVPVNLGGMGMVVGHELTHGFDDQGAQYDAAGNLVNWWQPDTQAQFKTRTQCVIDQYSQYTVTGGTHVNGANTVGENIADIGGIKLAFSAYRTLRASAPDAVVADGFTEDQQFFLGFAQAWCSKQRPDYEKLLATVDVHSPSQWRVDGALQATPEFARAFRCKAGAKMRPAKQCVVW